MIGNEVEVMTVLDDEEEDGGVEVEVEDLA